MILGIYLGGEKGYAASLKNKQQKSLKKNLPPGVTSPAQAIYAAISIIKNNQLDEKTIHDQPILFAVPTYARHPAAAERLPKRRLWNHF
jgi:hypothetical protein